MNIPIPFIGGGSGDSDECTATASDVLEGKTAVYNGSDDEPAAGTMKDYSGTTQSASASMDDSNSRVSLAVPNTGKYDTAARLYTGYSNLASLLGISADVIKKGVDILGITGTWEGYVAEAGDLYYRGVIGELGGSIVIYTANGGIITEQNDCILVDMDTSTHVGAPTYCGGIVFTSPINCANYSTLTMRYNVTKPATISYSGFFIALYTTRPTSADAFDSDSAYAFTGSTMMNEGSRYLTLDISGIDATMYVGIGCLISPTGDNYSATYIAELTRVSVS